MELGRQLVNEFTWIAELYSARVQLLFALSANARSVV